MSSINEMIDEAVEYMKARAAEFDNTKSITELDDYQSLCDRAYEHIVTIGGKPEDVDEVLSLIDGMNDLALALWRAHGGK